MMHRCTTSQGNMVGQCSCGLFPTQTPNSFSVLFSVPPNEMDHVCPFASSSSSSSSSVDCTLSLGTPSTRFTQDDQNPNPRSSSSCMSNFCWDLLHTKNSPSAPPPHKSSRGGNTTGSINNTTANDPLLARRCANCDTTSTPLWRNGPRGPKSLCNACGIRFKKEERRAAASTTTNGGSAAENMFSHQNHSTNNNNPWVHHSQSTQKMACFSPAIGNEFRFINDSDQDSDSGIPFLSWRLNVTDRPSLVHDFTR